MVTMPLMPPYSSTTMAMCTFCFCMSLNRVSACTVSAQVRGPQHLPEALGRVAVPVEKVPGAQNAHDIVDVRLIDRKAGQAAFPDDLQNLLRGSSTWRAITSIRWTITSWAVMLLNSKMFSIMVRSSCSMAPLSPPMSSIMRISSSVTSWSVSLGLILRGGACCWCWRKGATPR